MLELNRARRLAVQVTQILDPHIHRICVAGSIRRAAPMVGDIDIVCIPKLERPSDLFGPTGEFSNLVHDEIDRLCTKHPAAWSVVTRGQQSSILRLTLAGGTQVQVDIWFASEATWPSVLLCRTGSTEHNIWLSEYAKSRGFRWHPNIGLMRQDSVEVPAAGEEDIYHALGLPFIQPQDREAGFLSSLTPETQR